MRRVLLLTAVMAAPAFAQSGVWTGYVNGWQWTPQANTVWLGSNPWLRTTTPLRPRDRTAIIWSQIAAQNAYFSQMNLVERQKENARREEQDLALRKMALDQQERALAQQQLEQAWQAAEQQRLAAQAERRQTELATKAADDARAQLAAAQLSLQQKELELSLAQREKEIAAREAERLARPRTPGPAIYKWVDEDGVMHISTKKK